MGELGPAHLRAALIGIPADMKEGPDRAGPSFCHPVQETVKLFVASVVSSRLSSSFTSTLTSDVLERV